MWLTETDLVKDAHEPKDFAVPEKTEAKRVLMRLNR